jgi:hypothetical protein
MFIIAVDSYKGSIKALEDDRGNARHYQTYKEAEDAAIDLATERTNAAFMIFDSIAQVRASTTINVEVKIFEKELQK